MFVIESLIPLLLLGPAYTVVPVLGVAVLTTPPAVFDIIPMLLT